MSIAELSGQDIAQASDAVYAHLFDFLFLVFVENRIDGRI
jgi:hypothetical protein